MTPELTTMYDTIHDDAAHIPDTAAKAAGYVTGTPDIQWTGADWARLPRSGKVRVDQSAAGTEYEAGRADVYDMEQLAGTPARFAELAAARHRRGEGNCGYGSHITLAQAANELDGFKGLPAGWWHGTGAWLADPSLSAAEAAAFVGTVQYGGFLIRAVQWATPRSNPTLSVPGGTLAALNLDLSIADAAWFPAPPDGGKGPTWQAQALAQARALVAFLEKHQ